MEPKHFRWHGTGVLGQHSEASMSPLDVSLWLMKNGIFWSKAQIDSGLIIDEVVDSWLNTMTYQPYN